MPLGADVELAHVASQTEGYSGAELCELPEQRGCAGGAVTLWFVVSVARASIGTRQGGVDTLVEQHRRFLLFTVPLSQCIPLPPRFVSIAPLLPATFTLPASYP